jgi:hypothetical protein
VGMGKHPMLKVCLLSVCTYLRECVHNLYYLSIQGGGSRGDAGEGGGCEEGLGNPDGTMVMEDNQTTPPPEPTEELAEQHRTTHNLTEVSPLRTIV